MSFTCALRFDSAAEGAGTAGTARAIGRANLGDVVTARNGGTDGTATTWAFEWLSLPPDTGNGAGGTPGEVGLVQSGAGTTFDFTADVVGTYVMKLTVSDGASSAVDYLAFAVKTPGGHIVPGFLPQIYDPVHAFNFLDAQGWTELLNPFLRNGDEAPSRVDADELQWRDTNWRGAADKMIETVTRRWNETAVDGSAFEIGGGEVTPPLRVTIPEDGCVQVTGKVIMKDAADSVSIAIATTYRRVGSGPPGLVGSSETVTKTSGPGWTATFILVGNDVTIQATAAADVLCKAAYTATGDVDV